MVKAITSAGFAATLLGQVNATQSLPEGAIAIPMQRTANFNHYLVEASPGTPPQKSYLVVDTGSPTISFQWAYNPVCGQSDRPCDPHGVYDNTTSSTSIDTGISFNDALIDHGAGSLINDIVSLGDSQLGRLDFGQVETYYGPLDEVAMPIERIMGLAIRCSPDCDQAGAYLLPQLYNASLVNRRAISFYMGPDEPNVTNSKLILGGAFDRAKQGGAPFTVPMVDPSSQVLANGQTNSANVTAIAAAFANGTTVRYASPAREGTPTLQDSGNPYQNLPGPIFRAVAALFGVPDPDPYAGLNPVDCAHRTPTANNVTFEFATGAITVPLHRLVTDLGNGTCLSNIADGGDFTAQTSGANGAPFLRSTYATFDADARAITFSQVRYTDDEDVVALPA